MYFKVNPKLMLAHMGNLKGVAHYDKDFTSVLVSVTEDALHLRVCNPYVYGSTMLPIERKEETGFEFVALPFDTLFDHLKTVEQCDVLEFCHEGEWSDPVHLMVNGVLRANIKTLDPRDMLEFPLFPTTGKVEVDAAQFWSAVNTCSIFSRENTRPILTGIHMFMQDDNTMRIEATDAYRLVQVDIPVIRCLNPKFDVVVEGKAIELVLPNNGFRSDKVQLFLKPEPKKGKPDTRLYLAEYDGADFVLPTIEGAFPNTAAIVPKHIQTTLEIDAQELHRAVKQVQIFGRDSANKMTITVRNGTDQGMLHLAGMSIERGSSASALPVAPIGNDTEITINSSFMLDALKPLETTVELGINGKANPMVMRYGAVTYIFMPIAS